MWLQQGMPAMIWLIRPTVGAITLVLSAWALSACAGSDYGPKQTVGTLAGAGLGGLAGATLFDGNARIAGAAAGTLLGAFLGNEAGKSLDRADATYANRAEAHALEYAPAGAATPWRNPDTGSYGTVTPVRTYQTYDGYCREFQHKAKIGGRTEQVWGTACRSADGAWQVVN
jgi:surface antigen